MRLLSILFFCLGATELWAAGATQELTDARTKYEAALTTATKPLRDKFVQDLQQLKTKAMTAQNLDLAVAIDKELKTMIADGVGVASGNPHAAKFADTRWAHQYGGAAEFRASGIYVETQKKGSPFSGTWKALSASEIQVKRSDGMTWHFVLAPDGSSFTRREQADAIWRRVP